MEYKRRKKKSLFFLKNITFEIGILKENALAVISL